VLRPSPQPEPDLRSATLLTLLRARGLRADIAVSEWCGERDVRICVQRRRFGPAVELLCSATGDPQPPQWHAVRLTGGDRTVWRGPTCDDPDGDDLDTVVGFVEDLLVLDEAELAARYVPLG
jgi:hypothetical protein